MIRISADTAKAANDAINALIDAGSTNPGAHVRVYNGTKPTDPSVAVTTQTLLVEFVCPGTTFPASTSITDYAVATANDIDAVDAVASGTATWFRVVNKDSVAVMDGDAGDTASSAAMKLATTAIVSGVSVKIVSWTARHPQ